MKSERNMPIAKKIPGLDLSLGLPTKAFLRELIECYKNSNPELEYMSNIPFLEKMLECEHKEVELTEEFITVYDTEDFTPQRVKKEAVFEVCKNCECVLRVVKQKDTLAEKLAAGINKVAATLL